jgi:hypothetical protein
VAAWWLIKARSAAEMARSFIGTPRAGLAPSSYPAPLVS